MVSALGLNHCWPPRSSSGFRNLTDSDWSWASVPNSQSEHGHPVLSFPYLSSKYPGHTFTFLQAPSLRLDSSLQNQGCPQPMIHEHVQRLLSTSSEVNGWSTLNIIPWPKTEELQSPVTIIKPSPSSLCQPLPTGVIFSLKQLERLHLNKPSVWVLFNLWDRGFFSYMFCGCKNEKLVVRPVVCSYIGCFLFQR